jgi:import inner membrane translocase subunit TIM17
MAQREPCPGRIMDDLGGAFSMGCVGGSIFYFFKGFYNAPSRERFKGALTAIKNRAPILGGSFALWGGIFSTFDCSFIYFRQQESPINAILAGFLTGGLLAIRAGFQIAWRNALAGGVILSIIEGVNVAYTSMMLRQQALMMQEVSKLQEERMKRQMHGLPDFTPEEINERMSKLEQKAPGLFSSLFSNN